MVAWLRIRAHRPSAAHSEAAVPHLGSVFALASWRVAWVSNRGCWWTARARSVSPATKLQG